RPRPSSGLAGRAGYDPSHPALPWRPRVALVAARRAKPPGAPPPGPSGEDRAASKRASEGPAEFPSLARRAGRVAVAAGRCATHEGTARSARGPVTRLAKRTQLPKWQHLTR